MSELNFDTGAAGDAAPASGSSTSSEGVSAPSGSPVVEDPSSREDLGSPGTSPNAHSAALADAGFRLHRYEGSFDSHSATRIGTLNAGDRYASNRQNSQATADAALRGVSGTDSMNLRVDAPTASAPAEVAEDRPTTRRDPQAEPLLSESSSSGFVAFSLDVPTSEEEEFLGVENSEGVSSPRRRRSSTTYEARREAVTGGSSGESSPGGGSAGGGSAPAPTQRYVFDVQDVHNMGGTPSSLSIRDGSGNLVSSYELPAGNSRLSVDLAPGNYSIEARSGTRPGGGVDALDNFRVDVYSMGSSDSAGASGGEAGGSGGGSPDI